MADWEEIKRLAADFQKVQLSISLQRLSERNCIEILTWLKERKIIDLIHTIDGKDFLTPAQLVQDIKNELFISGGRINLVELAKIINVDLAHITAHLKDVLRGQKEIHSVLGQLIDNSYIVKIAGEINEKLVQQGQINIGELTIQYDLPADFLQQYVVEKHLGKIIHGNQDKNDTKVFFTESFIARSKSKIRGALTGLTMPTLISSILNQIHISDKLFFSLFDETIYFGSLSSRVLGAQYIPNVYTKSQNNWIKSFFKQNSYLEYDILHRMGISDYKACIRKQFGTEDVVYLNSCVVSKRILERIDADIEECISSKLYVDIQTALPSVFNDKDIVVLLNSVLTKQKLQQVITVENFIISHAFIETLYEKFDDIIKEKAKTVVETGVYQQYQTEIKVVSDKNCKFDELEHNKVDKREDRKKKATEGKSGGGTQGRETKTKSTKKANRGKRFEEKDGDAVESNEKKKLFFFNETEICNVIDENLEDAGLQEISRPLAVYLLSKLNDKTHTHAAIIYEMMIANRTTNRKQTHNELQNKLNTLIGDVRLFERGIKLLPSELQVQLVKYLLKTLCTDIVTEILNYLAAEQNLNVTIDHFNIDQKIKFVNDLQVDLRKALLPLVKSLLGQSIEDFMVTVEEGMACCSMIIKKVDKKKDRIIISNHKQVLLEQLNKCEDLALTLHLATLTIFTAATQCMLHASGKHVAAILSFLNQFLTAEQNLELMSFYDFVTLMLSEGSEAENAKEKLKEKVSVIRSIANEFKKLTGSREKINEAKK